VKVSTALWTTAPASAFPSVSWASPVVVVSSRLSVLPSGSAPVRQQAPHLIEEDLEGLLVDLIADKPLIAFDLEVIAVDEHTRQMGGAVRRNGALEMIRPRTCQALLLKMVNGPARRLLSSMALRGRADVAADVAQRDLGG
jgi:hypothetical protein